MSTTFVNVSGVVKFFNTDKSFGFVTVEGHGDAFIHLRTIGDHLESFKKGAAVKVDLAKRFDDGKFKLEVSSLISVTAPKPKPKPVTVLGVVDWYNPRKMFGFVNCGALGMAYLHASVCQGIIPGKGMAVRAVVVEATKGLKVRSFEYGEDIQATWQAEQTATAEVVVTESVESTEEVPPAEATVEAVSPKPKRIRRKKAAKPEPTEVPLDIAAEVAKCASNGAGGAMAEAFCASVH